MDAIVLFAHGSRDPLWRLPIEAVAQRIQAQQPHMQVHCAYLELCSPDLPTVTTNIIAAYAVNTDVSAKKALQVRIVPLFLGMGKHAREDLPELVEKLRSTHPQVVFELMPPVGEDPRVTQLLAQLALQQPGGH